MPATDHTAVTGNRRFRPGSEQLLFAALVLLFLEYAFLFILRTSFVIDGVRWFSLFDDAMVSMRYARNLVDGYGLVWNPGGVRVEGYTNFFWVLVMAAVHLLPVGASTVSLCVQILSALILAVNLWFVRKIALLVGEGSGTVVLGSVFLTAFYYPLNNWSLQGMEVGLLALTTTIVVWRLLSTKEGEGLPAGVLVLMGIGVLARTDMAPLYLALLLLHAIRKRRTGGKSGWRGIAVLVAVVVAHTAFRVLYYGDALPNTYYLKVEGIPLDARLGRGIATLWEFVRESGALLFVLPFSLFLTRRNAARATVLLLAAVLVQCAYSCYVGGDAWEAYGGANRYLSPVMPLLFILVVWAIETLLCSVSFSYHVHVFARTFNLKPLVSILLVGAVFWSFNESLWTSLTLQIPPLEVHNNEEMVQSALFIRRTTTPDATVAVVWAGAIPYYSERTCIDMLGKTDRHIARLPVRDPRVFIPGHDKWDYDYSIVQPLPDVIVQLWLDAGTVRPFVDQQYISVPVTKRRTMFYKRSSTHILFDALNSTP